MTEADQPAIPVPLLNALRLGRPLAVEVPAEQSGRRAWVSVHPRQEAEDLAAEREGWARSQVDRVFRLRHTEYDAEQVDGYDYDIGQVVLADVRVSGEAELLALLRSWDVDPAGLAPTWQTDWPE